MNMMLSLNLKAMVSSEDGEAKTTSYAVAEAFGKRHSDVLRSIKNMKCSDKFRERNFAFTLKNKQIGNTKRNTGFYRMTERGFMFLVMGFNGEKADAIKEAFINAFEWMANQLTQTFQSKWARYNQVSLEYKNRKQEVSGQARGMRQWQDDKPIFEGEIMQLETELQPSLPYMGGI
ncbi:MAG: Rha family transcriptional regulator [Acinetobacter sp.]